MKKYLPRYMDKELEESLEYMGAVLITGPKWCGKTTTAKQHCKSLIELQHPINGKSYLKLADTNPIELLKGEKPLLIDEWQMAPELWDTVRYLVDESDEDGLYILTGSTIVDESKIMHSGAGRIKRIVMRPMSLYESGESTGKISLLDLFNDENLNIDGITSNLTIPDLIFTACRGGWPESLNKKTKKQQLAIVSNYIDVICNSDVSELDGVKRNPQRVKAILKSYSRNISTLATKKTLMKDIKTEYEDISLPTYNSYLNALERLYVIQNIPAWSPNIRSANTIRKSCKKEFIDPSIAVASLNLTPEKLLKDFETFGFIFENLCIRDLLVYSSSVNGEILYYRDDSGLESDCVIYLNDGRYALIEFKLGNREIDKGAKNLLKLKKLIKTSVKNKKIDLEEPSFLAVITGGEIAYTRSDGVKVIPIGCLK
ncbi:MAG: DUF4143 domain-containing protein [Methanosphaera sp.]|uniref:ATP-binding protein n=1 Tax=Methanosphaera sp. TaxID=2666342 RepID=UPI002E78A1EB|nr:DUF4143 domain-containing protein [Methanosphaera sp.]MEE1117479.1 DUF4143 domain-containing protein [Methanosphaera sp.]MEE3324099.1 DUF4143 domain-containing protein [Methanosphaera sp.]MEE3418005.1 DUF4143 domain-containing protein [Methanosphaera sp.]